MLPSKLLLLLIKFPSPKSQINKIKVNNLEKVYRLVLTIRNEKLCIGLAKDRLKELTTIYRVVTF
jgi:hypothetical protein